MSTPTLRYDVIADDKTAKGIKSAQKNIGNLEGSVQSLGKALATVFAAQKVYNFGKAAAQAFAEDQKSAALLSKTVDNLGISFANPQISDFIASLEKASGIVDEQLRPAFQKLLTTTKSVGLAQKTLKNAVDIARGSGKSLETVVSDLSLAYAGQTKGLKKYGTGLSNAELSAMSFTQIMETLNKQFTGSNAAYLDTYAGKIDVLTVAVDNAKESIGKSIFDALGAASGGSKTSDTVHSIENITNGINALVEATGKAVGLLVQAYRIIDKITTLGGLIGDNGSLTKSKNKPLTPPAAPKLNKTQTQKLSTMDKAAEVRANKVAKAQTKAANAQTKSLKDQAALKKSQGVFDLQQIELVAALKGKLSEQDKLRAEAQLALLAGNDVLAKKLTDQILQAQDATGNLSKFLTSLPDAKNPFQYLDAYLDNLKTKADALTGGGNISDGNTMVPPSTNVPPSGTSGLLGQGIGGQAGVTKGGDVYVTVQGSVVSQQELLDAVQNGLQLQSLAGSPSVIGRIAGMFG